MSNQKVLEKHFERNEKMWKIWEQMRKKIRKGILSIFILFIIVVRYK